MMKKGLLAFLLVIIWAWLCLPVVSWAGHGLSLVALNPTGDPDASGGAVITTSSDGRVIVNVLVVGVEPGTHASHIHKGSCAEQGAIVHNLLDIPVDRSGHGSQVTTLQLRKDQIQELFSSPHYVNVHVLSTEGGIGGGITCGDITFSQLP